jgi:hypothetical protein
VSTDAPMATTPTTALVPNAPIFAQTAIRPLLASHANRAPTWFPELARPPAPMETSLISRRISASNAPRNALLARVMATLNASPALTTTCPMPAHASFLAQTRLTRVLSSARTV